MARLSKEERDYIRSQHVEKDFAIRLLNDCDALESEKAELLAALKLLHDNTKEYIEINHLGDPYHNQDMQLARAAIQHAEKE